MKHRFVGLGAALVVGVGSDRLRLTTFGAV